MPDRGAAIGIFDSGVGGLTVLRQVAAALPSESIWYLGDTARVPYGTKSPETVIRYARACARVLLERGIKVLVVACNTASAFAMDALASLEVPVIGVVEPGSQAAAGASRSNRIGVIGTVGTVGSGAYARAIRRHRPEAQVFSKACPLFVPLAEEGWLTGEIPAGVARAYLGELIARDVDTLVLGCTHYPLLKPVIAEVMGPGVTLVDSANETARVVARVLEEHGLKRGEQPPGEHRYLVSDAPENFRRVGSHFLGGTLDAVEWVDF